MTNGMAPPPPPPAPTASADGAKTEDMIALYQIDYQVESKGKTLGPSKKRVTFKFGFANLAAAAAAAPSSSASSVEALGPSYRGSEHEIVFLWSLATGRRIVTLDNRQVHISESGQNGWTSDRNWSTAFFVRSPGGTPVSLRIMSLTSKDHRQAGLKKSQVRPFDVRVNGTSFFNLNKIYELGTEAMRVEPARGGGGGGTPRAGGGSVPSSPSSSTRSVDRSYPEDDGEGDHPRSPAWGYPKSSPRPGYSGVPDPRNPHVATVPAESSRRRSVPAGGGVGGTTMANMAESSPRRSMPAVLEAKPATDPPALPPAAATPANNPIREASLISLEEEDVPAPVGAALDLFDAPAPAPTLPPPLPSLGTSPGVMDPFSAAPPPPPAATPPRPPQQMSMVQWQPQPTQMQPPRAASWAAPPSSSPQQFQPPPAAAWNAAPPQPPQVQQQPATWNAAPPSPQQQPPMQMMPVQQLQQRSASLAAPPSPAANPFEAAPAPTQQFPNVAASGAAYAEYQAPGY